MDKLRPYIPWLIAAAVLYVIVRARAASAPVALQPADQSGTDGGAQLNTLGVEVQHLAQSVSDLYNLSQSGAGNSGPHACPTGEHWNDALQSCALNAPCAPTAYWNGSSCVCLPGYITTDGGATCHPASSSTCGAGYVFDATLQYCVPSSGHY